MNDAELMFAFTWLGATSSPVQPIWEVRVILPLSRIRAEGDAKAVFLAEIDYRARQLWRLAEGGLFQ